MLSRSRRTRGEAERGEARRVRDAGVEGGAEGPVYATRAVIWEIASVAALRFGGFGAR